MRKLLVVTVLAALLLAPSLAVAGAPSLVLEWRIFLGEPGGQPATPLFVAVFADGKYAAVAGVEGRNTTLYVVDLNTTRVLLSERFPLSAPLCLHGDSTGASVVLDKGGGKAQEVVVTPDLHVVMGMRYEAGLPVFLAGCARYGSYYLIYGNAVVKGKSLEAMVDLVSPSGSVIARLVWGGSGDQLVKSLVVRDSTVVALVSNLTSGRVEAYDISFADEPQAQLWSSVRGLRVIDAYPVPDGIAVLGVGRDNRALVTVIGGNTSAYLPEGFEGLAIAGYAKGYLVVAGLAPNATTGLTDGALVMLNLPTGEAASANVAFGKQDVSFTAGTITGNETVLVAGMHGITPLLASYAILWPQPVTPQDTGEPPQAQETGPAWLAPMAAAAVVLGGAAAAFIVLRGRRQ